MKIRHYLVMLLTLGACNAAFAQGGDPHSGHSMGNAGGPACVKAKVSRFNPEHLSTVAPGSEFSFLASGAASPRNIHVSAKQIPIEVTTEDKETFYLVRGKLPLELRGPIRITVKVKAKYAKCDEEDGWMLKIAE